MRRILMFLILPLLLHFPVEAIDLTPPEAPPEVREFMPEQDSSFGSGLVEMARKAAGKLVPDIREAAAICSALLGAVVLVSLLRGLPGDCEQAADLAGTAAAVGILLSSSHSMIRMGMEVIRQISEYGKLLLPVMTGALAAQGGPGEAVALYGGTAFFDSLMSGLILKAGEPMILLYLSLAAACCALEDTFLRPFLNLLKSVMTWILKGILYVFTGYIAITGVVSGAADAAALKAAKITISGAVPVVGGILSDASEAVLAGMGTLKHTAGIYGMYAILAVCLGPFLKIGIHYLMLKVTACLCGLFGSKKLTALIGDFSGAMGFVLGMAGAVCLMQMISIVCFLKGAG